MTLYYVTYLLGHMEPQCVSIESQGIRPGGWWDEITGICNIVVNGNRKTRSQCRAVLYKKTKRKWPSELAEGRSLWPLNIFDLKIFNCSLRLKNPHFSMWRHMSSGGGKPSWANRNDPCGQAWSTRWDLYAISSVE